MKIELTGKITHDSQLQNVGDVLNLADAAAQRLIKLGVAKAVERKSAAKKPDDNPDKKSGEDSGDEPEENSDGESSENSDDGEDIIVDKTNIDTMTKDEIAQELSVLGIGYKSSATREQLAAQLKKAVSKEV